MVMTEETTPRWAFLTNHARALICIARDPGARLREIGERVGITERAAHRIVAELLAAGYITRTRDGRRNRYTVNEDLPLPDPIARDQNVGDLLTLLATTDPAPSGGASAAHAA
jgi:predicted transcriptional regulator